MNTDSNSKIQVLSISQCIPWENIPHAGGKTYFYYMNRIAGDPSFNLTMICHCVKGEENKAEFDRLHAKGFILFSKGDFFTNIRRVFWDLYGKLTGKTVLESYYKHRGYLEELKKLKQQDFKPDLIQLEWTCCVSLAADCRKLFPDAKILASEHDVAFLGEERKAALSANSIKKNLLEKRAEKAKQQELEALSFCDVILPHNSKDHQLLLDNGVPEPKLHTIVPYYQNLLASKREVPNRDILFWGAMSREENYSAALWFIDNVLSLIKDPSLRFVVVGSNPPEKLKAQQSERILVTGFVENPESFLRQSLCLAAPLLTGAGIKVKVLEALSAGLPVLTNSIGIEGIPAENGKEYLHCETPEEYAKAIEMLSASPELNTKMGESAKNFIKNSFDLETSGTGYLEMLKKPTSPELA